VEGDSAFVRLEAALKAPAAAAVDSAHASP
jgi:hypothetical protein